MSKGGFLFVDTVLQRYRGIVNLLPKEGSYGQEDHILVID